MRGSRIPQSPHSELPHDSVQSSMTSRIRTLSSFAGSYIFVIWIRAKRFTFRGCAGALKPNQKAIYALHSVWALEQCLAVRCGAPLGCSGFARSALLGGLRISSISRYRYDCGYCDKCSGPSACAPDRQRRSREPLCEQCSRKNRRLGPKGDAARSSACHCIRRANPASPLRGSRPYPRPSRSRGLSGR
jgi:hypothetical protein